MSPEIEILLLEALVVLGCVSNYGVVDDVPAFIDARAARVVRIRTMLAKLERVGGEE